MLKFFKVTEIWSGEMCLNPYCIKMMTKTSWTHPNNGKIAKTYIILDNDEAYRTIESIEEIMEMINGQ